MPQQDKQTPTSTKEAQLKKAIEETKGRRLSQHHHTGLDTQSVTTERAGTTTGPQQQTYQMPKAPTLTTSPVEGKLKQALEMTKERKLSQHVHPELESTASGQSKIETSKK